METLNKQLFVVMGVRVTVLMVIVLALIAVLAYRKFR